MSQIRPGPGHARRAARRVQQGRGPAPTVGTGKRRGRGGLRLVTRAPAGAGPAAGTSSWSDVGPVSHAGVTSPAPGTQTSLEARFRGSLNTMTRDAGGGPGGRRRGPVAPAAAAAWARLGQPEAARLEIPSESPVTLSQPD